jgi:hypothetical protein
MAVFVTFRAHVSSLGTGTLGSNSVAKLSTELGAPALSDWKKQPKLYTVECTRFVNSTSKVGGAELTSSPPTASIAMVVAKPDAKMWAWVLFTKNISVKSNNELSGLARQ